MDDKERRAIKVHGIQMPGFLTEGEAKTFIDNDKSFKGTDAKPVRLSGKLSKATFLSGRFLKGA